METLQTLILFVTAGLFGTCWENIPLKYAILIPVLMVGGLALQILAETRTLSLIGAIVFWTGNALMALVSIALLIAHRATLHSNQH